MLFRSTLNGGNGTDTLVATGNVNFKLTNSSLSGLGSDSLSGFEIANLTGGADSNSFDVSGWTGSASISGGTGTPTSLLGNTDAIVVSKDVNFTLTNSSLQTSDGVSISLSGITKATLTGGGGDNTFNLTGWTGSGKISGGAGNDTLTLTRDADITLAPTTLASPGYGTMSLSAIDVANLTGGSSNNVFTLNNWLGSGTLVGGGGSDTLVAKYTATNEIGRAHV